MAGVCMGCIHTVDGRQERLVGNHQEEPEGCTHYAPPCVHGLDVYQDRIGASSQMQGASIPAAHPAALQRSCMAGSRRSTKQRAAEGRAFVLSQKQIKNTGALRLRCFVVHGGRITQRFVRSLRNGEGTSAGSRGVTFFRSTCHSR